MQYMGGKVRISKYLVPVLQERMKDKEIFVDLFCGSCNIVSNIKAPTRIANDLHKELIALHKAVQKGWIPPSVVTEEDHRIAKNNSPLQEDYLKAFIRFGCSFAGDYNAGYARDGKGRNYALNAKNTLLKKHACMKDVQFSCLSYNEVQIPDNSLVYCDIPYKGTSEYSTGTFLHEEFYSWCKDMKAKGHDVVVSEYLCNVPEGWEVLWQYESKQSLRSKGGKQESTVEILMSPN